MADEGIARRLIRRRGMRLARVCLPSLLVLAGCDAALQAGGGKKEAPVAEVNGEPITREDARALFPARGKREGSGEAGNFPPRALVEQLVERRLLLQRFRETGEYVSEGKVRRFVDFIRHQYGGARKLGEAMKAEGIDRERWLKTMRETLEIELLLEKEVYSGLKVPESEIAAYYDRNKEKFRVGRRWRIRQIVVGSRKKASALRKRILDGESFASLAQKHSLGPERDAGGDLGYFEKGELPEDIENVVQSLKPGERSRVFRSPLGFHLLEVSERRLPSLRTLASARESIRKRLLLEKGRARLEGWLGELKRSANVQYHWENLENGLSG